MSTIQDKQIADLLLQAVARHQQGDLAQAQQGYRQVLGLNARQPDAWHLLGVVAQQQGRVAEAIDFISKAIEVSDNRWAFHSNLACAQQDNGQLEAAIASYRRAIELGGESATLLSNLGTAYQAAGRRAEAQDCYQRAIKLDANHAEAYYNLGNLRREAGAESQAIECYEDAIRLRPLYAEAHVNLANLLQEQNRCEEAIRRYERALAINNGDPETHYNLARALKAEGRYAQALAAYERAIELKPDHAAAHMLRGLILLRQGNFKEGWTEYDWRWQKKDEAPLRNLPQPLWQGESLAGRTLLVYSEQGVGDEIMFGSCLDDCIAQAGHCVIECDPRLVPLYARSFPKATVHAREGWDEHGWLAQLRPIEVQTPIGNLPRYYRGDAKEFPARRAYLKPDESRVADWRRRLADLGDGLKIGISWRGASDHEQKYRRSIPLADWRPLLQLAGVRFVNLQYGNAAAEIADVERALGIEIHDWEDVDPRRDLDGLAAQMSALDLVVTIGNTNAHLAGALGVDVWTLLPASAGWRWMDDRDDTPWYPGMRLMRQSPGRDWTELLQRVRDAVLQRQGIQVACRVAPTTPPNTIGDGRELLKRRVRITDSRWGLKDASIQDAFARAVKLQKAGDTHHAEGIYREILAHAPHQVDALHRLGGLLKQTGRRDEAIEVLAQAAKIGAAKPAIQFDYGVALTEAHRSEEAEKVMRRVIELDPNQGPAFVNLGVIYERLNKLDEALSICQRAVKLMPNSVQALYNLGNVYLHRGRLDEALAMYDRLLAIDPTFPRALWNRGLTHLLAGNFAEGWPGYQYREAAEQVQLDKFDIPLWDGSSLAGKKILVHAEQGVGDEIMFATCLPDVMRQAREVLLTCDPRLTKLFIRSFPGVEVQGVVRGATFNWKPPQGIDVYTHLGTLPLYCRPSWDSFPRQRRLLVPDARLVDLWRERFAALGPGPKIGISWRAGGQSSEQRRRTSLLDHWRPLFEIPGARFVNLQYGDWAADLEAAKSRWGVTIHDWEDADPLTDMENFAAQIAALDLVVSVGNTTIHMAGAVGTPAWAVLPRVPGWRYLLNHDWLPWYDSVRLRRQSDNRDWDDVFSRVAQEARERLALADGADRAAPGATSVSRCAIAESAVATPPPAGVLPKEKIGEAFVGAMKKHRAGRLDEAEQVYRQVIDLEPRHADALHLLGVIATQTGRLPEAIEFIERAIEVDPANAVYHYNLSSALRAAKRDDDAIAHLRRAVECNTELAEAHLNLGAILHAQGKHNEAIGCYERALAARPDYAEAHNNIGCALRDQGRFEHAIQCFKRAIELRPNYADAHLHLAGVERELGQTDDALASFDRGLTLSPKNVDAHINRAMLRMQQGQFAAGWDEWEWRWALDHGPSKRPFTQPRWAGEPLADKTLLVHMEQGVGDEIMFATCLPDVLVQAGHVVLECDPRLAPLFRRSFPQATVHARQSWQTAPWLAHAPAIDYQIPAGSLPRLLRRSATDFPRREELLGADPDRVQHWRRQLAELGPGLKIGVSWRGGKADRDGKQRSTSVEQWAGLAAIDGVNFVNLQYDDCDADLARFAQVSQAAMHCPPGIDVRNDLDDLAALVASLDLVVTVSNFNAHLAGAVGTPAWVLLPRAPSWRWFMLGDEALWYRTVRLVRQRADGRWDSVFERLRKVLTEVARINLARRESPALPLFPAGLLNESFLGANGIRQ